MTQLTAKPFTARPLTARPLTAYPFGESTSVSNPLVWLAAYPDSDGVMQAEVKGAGDAPVFVVDDGLLLPDHEGIYRTTAEDTPPWHGARKVTNLLSYSEDFSNAVWTKTDATYTGGITDPNGGTTAATLTATASNGRFMQLYGAYSSAATYVISLWLRRRTGSGTVQVWKDAGFTTVTLTSEWQRFSTLSTSPAGFYVGVRCVTSGDEIDVAFAQLENVTGQTIQTPSEYVQTGATAASKYFSYANGNTVVDNVVVPAKGATLDPLPSLYAAPSYTNSLTYSNDLTNAVWTQTGTSVSALNAVGLTGAPNTATTLTDDDGAAYEKITRQVTVPADTNTNIFRTFVYKDADETRFPEIQHYYAGGESCHLQINTKTGAAYRRAGTGPYEVNDVGDWWEILVGLTNNGSDTVVNYAPHPAVTTTWTSTEVAATGSIIVGNAELHLNKTIAQVRGSAPIITAASTVTTTAISMSYDIANHSDTQGAYYCEMSFWKASAEGATQQGIISFSGSGFGAIYGASQAGRLQAYDGTNVPLINTSWTSEESVKAGVAYGDNFVLIAKGVSGTETAYDGGFNGATGAITLLSSIAPTAFPSLIRNIRRYDLPYDEAKAKIDELMK